ncbi:snare associated Golgi protein-domain-containing protein [Pavlovales sp. CCMP2436]|nr:snare associated Golgi protein-domain-containing protein [Pavlovales sp. CCMP2436]
MRVARLLALALVAGLHSTVAVRSSLARGRAVRTHSTVMRDRRSSSPERQQQQPPPGEPETSPAYWTRWSEWVEQQQQQSSPAPKPKDAPGGVVALGALGLTALISEAVQVVGTGGLLYLAKDFAGASNVPEAIDYLSHFFQALGPAGYALFGSIMVFLQVVPVASGFLLTLSAGVIFGSTAKATILVSAASTTSATIAFVIARYLLRDRLLDLAKDNKQVITLDRALSKADFGTSLLVILLLRSSPLLPFTWASYLFGVSTVPFGAYFIGSWVGSLPAILAYVQVGQLGSEALLSGHPPSWLVYFGIAATLGATAVISNIASGALKDLDIDLED